jgi:hypothetical protein
MLAGAVALFFNIQLSASSAEEWLKELVFLRSGEGRVKLEVNPKSLDELIVAVFLGAPLSEELFYHLERGNPQPRQMVFGAYALRPRFLPETTRRLSNFLYTKGAIPVFVKGGYSLSVDLTALTARLLLPARAHFLAKRTLLSVVQKTGWPDVPGGLPNLTSTFLAGRSLGYTFDQLERLVSFLPEEQRTGPIHEAFAAFLRARMDF